VAPAWLLFFFAPVSAEYLIGYDDIIGEPLTLVFGLLIFGPLYGAPAVLIRETTRRAGRGWPTMLLLGLAFGLVEAGLVDQSLFNPAYRDIPYWDNLREPTLIPAVGTSAYMALTFLAGHAIGSICAPIALAEALAPGRSTEPWLRTRWLVVMAVLWAAGAALVLADTLSTETFRPSAAQLGGTVLLVAGLIALAFTRPRLGTRRQSPGAAPSPLAVLAISACCFGVRPLLDSVSARTSASSGWLSTLAGAAVLALLGALVARWSRRDGWGALHVLAVAVGALVAVAAAAFSVEPLGDVPAATKYAVNSFLFVLVLALAGVAASRQRAHAAARTPADGAMGPRGDGAEASAAPPRAD